MTVLDFYKMVKFDFYKVTIMQGYDKEVWKGYAHDIPVKYLLERVEILGIINPLEFYIILDK